MLMQKRSVRGGNDGRQFYAPSLDMRFDIGHDRACFSMTPAAFEPTRRFMKRLAPPEQNQNRQGHDHERNAPALGTERNDEKTNEGRRDKAEREEPCQSACETAAVLVAHELDEERGNDPTFGTPAHPGQGAQYE